MVALKSFSHIILLAVRYIAAYILFIWELNNDPKLWEDDLGYMQQCI